MKKDSAAHIEITRYRYQKDKRTGKTPTYTEYRFYINYELKASAIRGQCRAGKLFMSIHAFKMYCLVKFKETGIDVFKPRFINLGFEAQR